MATNKRKKVVSPVEAKADPKRPEFPTEFKINYAKDGFGGSGYVLCLDLIIDEINPNILWLEQALLPDRATGKFIHQFMYIIPTRELVSMVTDGSKLTWSEVNTRQ